MTAGLITSRQNKNTLFKLQLAENTPANVNKYKIFKQTYFKTVRAAKKLYFQRKFQENTGNSKKTWDTLNEALGKEKKNQWHFIFRPQRNCKSLQQIFYTSWQKYFIFNAPNSKTTRGLHSL